MTETLITDDFSERSETAGEIEHNYEPHNIVYGALGWTDGFDDASIDLMLKAGTITQTASHSGVDWETRIFVSVKGNQPT